MATYRTEQRKAVVDFLRRHADETFTVSEAARRMRLDPQVIVCPGTSTVYRLLTQLTQEGHIKRFVLEDKRQYLYQALACHHPDRHLHLKCNQCGRFIHMQEEVSSQILQQITREFGFLVDEEQTVLYGHCTQCHTPADA